MYNEIVKAKLDFCLEHISFIEKYTKHITDAHQFIESYNGLTYDGTLMRLQALGESLKAIATKYPQVISDLNYAEINDVMRFRDYVSHHYELLEHDIVYNIVQSDIPKLKQCLFQLLSEKF
ncbi:MAG TPA: DUF86 domain-containing protein [Chitinophagales bacterium]|nr:DUF86 domain-containing protein [Chitinophagales bacterium]HRP39258.1 DUF86 domain-containing protein [Chitinophagales bacterium]